MHPYSYSMFSYFSWIQNVPLLEPLWYSLKINVNLPHHIRSHKNHKLIMPELHLKINHLSWQRSKKSRIYFPTEPMGFTKRTAAAGLYPLFLLFACPSFNTVWKHVSKQAASSKIMHSRLNETGRHEQNGKWALREGGKGPTLLQIANKQTEACQWVNHSQHLWEERTKEHNRGRNERQ